MKSRRNVLASLSKPPDAHAGLWLDKFLVAQTEERSTERPKGGDSGARKGDSGKDDGVGAKAALILALSSQKAPSGYWHACQRRRADFTAIEASERALVCEATARGRIALGLGEKVVIEAGLRLEHTWGVPVLPGSALKGLAAATAHLLMEDDGWRKRDGKEKRDKTYFDELFGSTDESGKVFFHDAWWVPENDDALLPIHLDVITVHHQDYYQGPANPPAPSDMDSPNPVAFASVSGSYLVVVEGERPWCDAAMVLLRVGLEELGIGAKTNAGYGRMKLPYVSERDREEAEMARAENEQRQQRERLDQERVAAEERRKQEEKRQEQLVKNMDVAVKRINNSNASAQVPKLLAEYSGDLEIELATRVVKSLGIQWLREDKRKDVPWVVALLAAASSAPGKKTGHE